LGKHEKGDFDHARDELLSHIHRCGVLKASTEQQEQWLEETMQYMGERYDGLKKEELDELRQIGQRFCQPVIPHGKGHSALTDNGEEEDNSLTSQDGEGTEKGEMAGAA
jgi:hypothetical protein